jgi:hypothetical protein
VVFDGIITQRLVDIAAERGVPSPLLPSEVALALNTEYLKKISGLRAIR